jgi:hypothetical protein
VSHENKVEEGSQPPFASFSGQASDATSPAAVEHPHPLEGVVPVAEDQRKPLPKWTQNPKVKFAKVSFYTSLVSFELFLQGVVTADGTRVLTATKEDLISFVGFEDAPKRSSPRFPSLILVSSPGSTTT